MTTQGDSTAAPANPNQPSASAGALISPPVPHGAANGDSAADANKCSEEPGTKSTQQPAHTGRTDPSSQQGVNDAISAGLPAPVADVAEPPVLPPPKAVASAPLPDPAQQPQAFLDAIVARIAVTDKEGFFYYPVRESDAPNYYTVIKQPMCFHVMRQRIQGNLYRSWRQFREELQLIPDNAKRYNNPKTLVHKQAIKLHQHVSKALQTHELELRKALTLLHPHGDSTPSAAEPGRAADKQLAQQRQDGATNMLASPIRADALSEQQASVPPSPHTDGTSLRSEPKPEVSHPGSFGSLGTSPLPPLPPVPRDPIVGYISEDDEDAHQGMPPPDQPLDSLLGQLRMSAYRLPYGRSAGQEEAGPSSMSASADAPTKAASGSGRTPQWRCDRRTAEWRARWLELRMRELHAQQRNVEEQIARLLGRPGGDGAAAVGGRPAGTAAAAGDMTSAVVGAAGPVETPANHCASQPGIEASALAPPASCANQQVALASAATARNSGATASSVPRPHGLAAQKRLLQGAAAEFRAVLPHNTFFLMHSKAGAAHDLTVPQQQLQAGQTPSSMDDERAERQLPGAIYGALELLEQQLLAVRGRLADVFKLLDAPDNGPMGMMGSGHAGAGAFTVRNGQLPLLSGGQQQPMQQGQQQYRRPSGGRDRAARPGLLMRLDSGSKRKRSEMDYGDLTTPGSARAIDRQPSAPIFIPPVRELPTDELNARIYATVTWSQNYRLQGAAALRQVPLEVAAVLEDEGSSSEDTSDEAFRLLHQPEEDKEHSQHMQYAAEGQRRRNKGQGQNSKGGSAGNKTPRGAVRGDDMLLSEGADESDGADTIHDSKQQQVGKGKQHSGQHTGRHRRASSTDVGGAVGPTRDTEALSGGPGAARGGAALASYGGPPVPASAPVAQAGQGGPTATTPHHSSGGAVPFRGKPAAFPPGPGAPAPAGQGHVGMEGVMPQPTVAVPGPGLHGAGSGSTDAAGLVNESGSRAPGSAAGPRGKGRTRRTSEAGGVSGGGAS